MDHGTWACPMPAMAHEVKAAAWHAERPSTLRSKPCGKTGMRMHRALIRLLSFAGLCACASIALPARAQNAVEQFYRGKTVTILIGHPAGGSDDPYAPLAAGPLRRFIPGNPHSLEPCR